ncbi:MAG: DUF2157 domain-containing protein [bacterium]
MNKQAIQWLYGELPQLVAQGILTSDADARLRARYGPLEPARPARLAVIIFGVLGALLIGAGIILVLAHNWEGLSRPVRAGLSFLPLVLAQGLAAWVIFKRPQSTAWREGAGTLLFLMIGSSISLVAQTYNISGDLPRFLLTWALLGLPAVYLLNAVVPALLYLWGITEWSCHLRFEDGFAAGYWPLVALLLPLLAIWMRAGRYQVRPTLLLWAFCVSVTVAAGVTIERVLPGLWIMLYAGLFALMFLVGEFWFAKAGGFWARPLRHFGSAGVLLLAFIFTFEWPWRAIGFDYWYWDRVHAAAWRAIPDAVLGSLIPITAIVLLGMTVRRKTPLGLLFGLAPILAILGYALTSLTKTHAPAAGIFNLYLLVAGLWLLVTGIRDDKQGQMNVGLLTITALIIARFFDSDLDFLLRGVIFIALGIAFLVTNTVMLRRKGASHAQA